MALSFLYLAFVRVLQVVRLPLRKHTDLAIEVVNLHHPHRPLDQRPPSNVDAPTAISDVGSAHLRRTDILGGSMMPTDVCHGGRWKKPDRVGVSGETRHRRESEAACVSRRRDSAARPIGP
jgi:hypothetical protein